MLAMGRERHGFLPARNDDIRIAKGDLLHAKRDGATAQPQVQASDTFVVDRKINVTVAEVGNSATIVAPTTVR